MFSNEVFPTVIHLHFDVSSKHITQPSHVGQFSSDCFGANEGRSILYVAPKLQVMSANGSIIVPLLNVIYQMFQNTPVESKHKRSDQDNLYCGGWGKMFIGKSVTLVYWNTGIIFDLDVENHLWSIVGSSLVLVIIVCLRRQVRGGEGSCWEGGTRALFEGALTPWWGGGWWSLLPPGQCAWLAQIPALDFPIPQLYLRPIFYTLKWSHCP